MSVATTTLPSSGVRFPRHGAAAIGRSQFQQTALISHFPDVSFWHQHRTFPVLSTRLPATSTVTANVARAIARLVCPSTCSRGCVNFTIAGGRVQDDVISNTPLFFGAEPAEVQGGPMKGLRVLPGVEDKARALVDALDASQRAMAVLGTRLPVDILSGNSRAPDLGSQLNPMGLARQPEPLRPEGLPASGMTPQQKQLLRRLIDDYVSCMPEEIAAKRARVLAGADFDRIHFAWIGATSAADAPPPIPGLGCNPGDTRWVCMPLGAAQGCHPERTARLTI